MHLWFLQCQGEVDFFCVQQQYFSILKCLWAYSLGNLFDGGRLWREIQCFYLSWYHKFLSTFATNVQKEIIKNEQNCFNQHTPTEWWVQLSVPVRWSAWCEAEELVWLPSVVTAIIAIPETTTPMLQRGWLACHQHGFYPPRAERLQRGKISISSFRRNVTEFC